MLQFKQPQVEPEQPPPRWNIGLDRRRVSLYVGLALIAGFAGGFLATRSSTPKGTTPPSPTREIRPQPPAENTESDYRKVSRILRADTIEVDGVGPVRMLGIESPDGKSPREIYAIHGQRALSFVERAFSAGEVRIEYDATTGDKDNTGQAVAYLYTRDGKLINGEMVRLGLAFVRSGEQFRLANDFRAYERDAMQSMRGLWGPSAESASARVPAASPSKSSPSDDKPRKLMPLPPSAFGENIPAVSSPVAAAPGEQSVWVSAADKMYHKSACEFLGKKKQSLALSRAKLDGYTACSRCYASTVMKAP